MAAKSEEYIFPLTLFCFSVVEEGKEGLLVSLMVFSILFSLKKFARVKFLLLSYRDVTSVMER